MLDSFSKLRTLLEKEDLVRLAYLFVIVVLMSLLEVIGIDSILPFLHLAANPDSLQQHEWLATLMLATGIERGSGKATLFVPR